MEVLRSGAGADVEDPLVGIKLGYRYGLSLIWLRDYVGAGQVMKGLKKRCNVHEELDMAGQV